jgi:hypothetical protein
MKPTEIVLRRRTGRKRENDEGVNPTKIVSTYVNIIMYPSIQLFYVNKIILC